MIRVGQKIDARLDEKRGSSHAQGNQSPVEPFRIDSEN